MRMTDLYKVKELNTHRNMLFHALARFRWIEKSDSFRLVPSNGPAIIVGLEGNADAEELLVSFKRYLRLQLKTCEEQLEKLGVELDDDEEDEEE